MAPSFESLLCAEDNNSVFDDNDFGAVEEFEAVWSHRNRRSSSQNQSFDGLLPPLQSDECLAVMVEKESQHLPAIDYLKRLQSGDLDLGSRKEAIAWIGKVHAHFGFGPLCAYLSMNYLDRFLAAYEMPKGKTWMIQLLAVACLSLSAKMEETEVPLTLDLQVGESEFVFESKTIQRMELLVLSTLKWRMQAVTPFTFIDSFLHKINGDQNPITTSMLQHSIKLVLSTIKGIDFLEFRPSEVAAAVAISVAGESQTVDIEKALSVLPQLAEKAKVAKCIELIHDLELISASRGGNGSAFSAPQSPIGVLDAACLSYKSDDTTDPLIIPVTSPQAKRRRLDKSFETEL